MGAKSGSKSGRKSGEVLPLPYRPRPDRLRREEAEDLRQRVLDYASYNDISEKAVSEVISAIDRDTRSAGRWGFMMVSETGNAFVVDWLASESKRPIVALRLWSKLLVYVRDDTNEITKTRAELADLVGVKPDHVSEIMSELIKLGAVYRLPAGRAVKYCLSPLVATHLPGAARDRAQAKALVEHAKGTPLAQVLAFPVPAPR